MEEEQMPRLNLNKDAVRLTVSDLHYMKLVEEDNLKRVKRLKKLRFSNRVLGSVLAGVAASIYCYTIYAVKQEKFLDDFEEPEKIADDE